MDFFKNIINRIEKARDFVPYLFIYVLTIAARIILKPFAETTLYSPAETAYYAFFYLNLSLGLIILLKLFIREDLLKITKTIFVFILVILLGPLIDILLIGSKNPGYLTIIKTTDIFHYYLTLFGGIAESQVSLGIRLEVLVILLCIFLYARIKTNSWVKAGVIILFSYTLLFFFGATPFLLKVFKETFNLRVQNLWPLTCLQYLMLLNFIIWNIYFWLLNKKTFLEFWRKVELTTVFNYSGIFILGTVLTKHTIVFSNFSGILAFLTALLAIFYGYVFLKSLDLQANYEINCIAKLSENPNKYFINPVAYHAILILSAVMALVCSYFSKESGWLPLLLLMAFLLCNIVYIVPTLSPKHLPVLSKVLLSCCVVWMVLYGYYFTNNTLQGFPQLIIWYFLIFFTLALNFMDIKSQQIDSYFYFFTLPTMLRMDVAKKIIGLFVLAAFLVAPFIFKIYFLFPLMLIFGLIEYFVINRDKDYNENRIFYLYLIVLYIVIFYLLIK